VKHRLLLVDDDLLHLESTQEFLQNRGFAVDTASNGAAAIAQVRANPHLYSLVIVDYRMQDQDGAKVVELLTAINPDIYILIFSGDSSREAVLQTTRRGARGFVDKSEGTAVFLSEVRKWCLKFEATHLSVNRDREPDENEREISRIGMVGRSPALAQLALLVEKLRDRQGPVLILGESGTGKELIARALHDKRRGPFRAVNCASFSSNPQLMASTLFGYAKGAFTGAVTDKRGLIEEVGGGTLFLDEIYALPLSSQLELLRVLQEKILSPVGSTREIPLKFRLIASAKPDLLEAVKQKTFAPDLFYRIGRTVLQVPALKDRPEDLEPLVQHFCEKWSRENGESKTFLLRTLPFLQNYRWPGNVRELENLVANLLDITEDRKIAPHHLDSKFFQSTTNVVPAPLFALKERIAEVEKQHLLAVLGVSRTLREASRRMKVSLTTVLRLMKKHGIEGEKHLSRAETGKSG